MQRDNENNDRNTEIIITTIHMIMIMINDNRKVLLTLNRQILIVCLPRIANFLNSVLFILNMATLHLSYIVIFAYRAVSGSRSFLSM